MTTVSTPATTRTLLTGLIAAGPLWATVSLAQAVTRPGFDLTRHPLSQLSTGELGWLQIATFVLAGLLTVAGAAGLRRVLAGRPGGRWAPRLVGVYGLGWVVAGLFVVDPGNGFPVGSPPAMAISWHAAVHLVAGQVAFIALIAACFVLGRHFSRSGETPYAIASRVAGAAAFLGICLTVSGVAMAGLAVGVITATLWIAVVAARYRRIA